MTQDRQLRPWLWLPPGLAHSLTPLFLRIYEGISEGSPLQWQGFQWRDLKFANPLGIAGGLDKNAEFLHAWWKMGVGFVEVGTVTPLPQAGNPGVVLERDLETHALWNKMGFPSIGMNEVYFNLLNYEKRLTPVFVNIGKNRQTPNSKASEDYRALMMKFANVADAFVINISSPNTAGLRELIKSENLRTFLQAILQGKKDLPHRPVLLKLSPDMTKDELAQAVATSIDLGIDGFILTNTTLAREAGMSFSSEGGVSGAPLRKKSYECLQTVVNCLGSSKSQFLIVSAGGILNADDVAKRLEAGANLVQMYSALVFEGPQIFKSISHQLAERRINA